MFGCHSWAPCVNLPYTHSCGYHSWEPPVQLPLLGAGMISYLLSAAHHFLFMMALLDSRYLFTTSCWQGHSSRLCYQTHSCWQHVGVYDASLSCKTVHTLFLSAVFSSHSRDGCYSPLPEGKHVWIYVTTLFCHTFALRMLVPSLVR